jgi:LmbE family N-acetylglucosaminyl deacetylase
MVLAPIRPTFPFLHHLLMQHTSTAYGDSHFGVHRNGMTPTPAWDRNLQSGDSWQPAAGPLLVVGPNPHDEILGAGGLIHTWVSWGHDVTVLSVTDGESDDADAEHLDLMRRDELRAALRKLCATHVSVVRMGLRDGHINESRNRLRMAIDALLEPRMTVIAPFEHDGPPNHNAVGKVCRESAQANGLSLARYPLRAWDGDPALLEAGWARFPLDMEARRAKAHALQCFRIDSYQRSFEAFLL